MSKSTAQLKVVINNKYPNSPNSKFPSEFFAMSNAGFDNASYKSATDVAVHLTISTFNTLLGNEKQAITTHPINLDMIFGRLNLSGRKSNSNRVKESITQSIKNLEESKIIQITYLTDKPKDDTTALFIVKQAMSQKVNDEGEVKLIKTFSMITPEVFTKLMLVEKDNERFILMALYMSIAYRIYAFKAPEGKLRNSTQAMLSAYEKAVNFQKLDKTGQLVGLKSHATVAKYVEKLSDMELIAYYKVATEGYQVGQWKYQISKYEERDLLKGYLLYKLDYHNDVFPIVDVFDESVVKVKTSTSITDEDKAETIVLSEQEIDLGIDLDELVTEMIA